MKVKLISEQQAKEINPLGKEPELRGQVDTQARYNSMDRHDKWKHAQTLLRTFLVVKTQRKLFIGAVYDAKIIRPGEVEIL